jgi:hypothetical protein
MCFVRASGLRPMTLASNVMSPARSSTTGTVSGWGGRWVYGNVAYSCKSVCARKLAVGHLPVKCLLAEGYHIRRGLGCGCGSGRAANYTRKNSWWGGVGTFAMRDARSLVWATSLSAGTMSLTSPASRAFEERGEKIESNCDISRTVRTA